MTIASALTSLNTDIQNARTAITAKGGTVTSGGGSSQLATDIATIPTEISNYNFDYILKTDGSLTTTISAIAQEAYLKDSTIVGLNWNLEHLNASAERMFRGCSNLKFINFPKLKDINYPSAFFWMFRDCTSLTSVSFPKLETIYSANGDMFYGCTSLKYVDFPALKEIQSSLCCLKSMFYGCSSLESVSFPALSYIKKASNGGHFGDIFHGCLNIKHIIFGALTTQSFNGTKTFKDMMTYSGSDCIHTIHFPSNLESTIQTLDDYPLFGGTSGYVVLAFDLPATS